MDKREGTYCYNCVNRYCVNMVSLGCIAAQRSFPFWCVTYTANLKTLLKEQKHNISYRMAAVMAKTDCICLF